MDHSNCRGQTTLELVVIALVLTTALFAIYLIAEESRDYLKPVWLSREVKR